MALAVELTNLQGKRVLVTGGTTGIGRAIALLLASHGARILTFGRDEDPLSEVIAQIRSSGGTADGFSADVGKADEIELVFAKVDEVLGGVDILVSNAALPAEGIMDMQDADWRYVVNVNLVGMLACVREAARRM